MSKKLISIYLPEKLARLLTEWVALQVQRGEGEQKISHFVEHAVRELISDRIEYFDGRGLFPRKEYLAWAKKFEATVGGEK